jgi:Ca-activated chloride channel family protein
MTDELNSLKKVFEAADEIKASATTKKKAMTAAMQSFEKYHYHAGETEKKNVIKENSKKNQGNFIGNRPKEASRDTAGFVNLLFWRKLMKLSYIIIPTVAASALAILVLVFNPQQSSPTSPQDRLVDETAAQTELAKNKQSIEREARSIKNEVDDSRIVIAAAQKDTSNQRLEQKKTSERQDDTTAGTESEPPVEVEEMMMVGALSKQSSPSVLKRESRALITVTSKEKIAINPNGLSPRPKVIVLRESNAPADVSENSNKIEATKTNPLKWTKEAPVSTFSIDVDTVSYSFMRAVINQNSTLPPKNGVRIEELINYFPYDYPAPNDTKQPFKVTTTVMPTPWNTNTKLLHIGIKGYQLPKQEQPTSNLVFLLDTSGSMSGRHKLPLLKNSFKLLLSTLAPTDTVSIVAYAGSAGVVLAPTKVKQKATILQALERLNTGGSTAGGAGIRLAYQLAEQHYDKTGVNRVILATDGDFNVGISSKEALKSFIDQKRQSGVFLSVLGFGMGNYNDELMQALAQNGNGNAAYIDSLSEARKVLIEEASSTLFTIANDVKIQMEFNPKVVSQYRLIGYETRHLKREDFNNDKVDAGDIGSGHTVTALYELTLVGAENSQIDPLRYTTKKKETAPASEIKQTEYGFLKLRYKLPKENKSQLIETPLYIADTVNDMKTVSSEIRFATAVAAFGQLLRGGTYTGAYNYDEVIKLAQGARGSDLFGYRAEFITLVRLAKTAEAM